MLLGLHLFFGYFVEHRAKRRLAELFGQYVPPELVDEMSRDPEHYTMEGRSAELTVLFADVRGFTTLAETLPPDELAQLMNDYLSAMTDVIRAYRGTLDKYVGDAMVAFWGAPLADPQHARHAVEAALAMQAALSGVNQAFCQPRLAGVAGGHRHQHRHDGGGRHGVPPPACLYRARRCGEPGLAYSGSVGTVCRRGDHRRGDTSGPGRLALPTARPCRGTRPVGAGSHL
jgi:hypothetical protein